MVLDNHTHGSAPVQTETRTIKRKHRPGRMGSAITRRCVALLGPVGYWREWLVEKWARDSKINDIHEGTLRIQQLVVARNIPGYSRAQMK